MRIGFETTPITTTRTGVGHYCYHLLNALLEIDRENEYRGFSSGMEPPDLAHVATRAVNRHLAVPTRLLYRTWGALHRPRVDRLLHGVDIIHATNFVLPPAQHARRVLTIHDITFLAVPEMCSPKITRYFARHIRAFAKDADAVLVHSDATRQDLVQRLDVPAEKITVAPPGVDVQLHADDRETARAVLRERYQINAPFILYVGTLEPRKNVVGALRAFAQSKAAVNHQFVLVGKRGWNCEPIFETIDTLGLAQRVRHLGYLANHGDLAAFYSAADAFLFPTYYEGFGLPVLEAMACRCPVVTSNVSAIPEVVNDCGLMAAPEDVAAHAAHLDQILPDPEFADSLRQRGLARAEQFPWTRCAEITLQTYTKVAA